MLTSSRGIALLLALAVSGLSIIFLAVLGYTSRELLLTIGGLTFSFTFVLLYVALEFLIFKEINNIYAVMERIQKKDFNKAIKKSSKASLFPLRKINRSINAYALAKNREIEALQKNDSFRREFIADISHELKTPIFAAQSYVHTLLDGAVEDTAVRYKFLKRAANSLNTLEKLVQALLTLNEMESGVIKFNFELTDMKEIILESIEQLEQKAAKRNVTIRFSHDSSKKHTVLVDRDKIARAVQNLIANAIRYNHKDGEVLVKLKATKKNVKIMVKDSGKGIAPEHLNRIFERFYRVEKSRSREQGGMGLGLAIVKHILEGHKSKISVSSKVGKGSIFSFALPLVNKPGDDMLAAAQ